MIHPYGQQPPPDAILCPMADEPWHAMCRLCDGRGWVQRDAVAWGETFGLPVEAA